MAEHIPISGTFQVDHISRLDRIAVLRPDIAMTNRAILTHLTVTIRPAGRVAGLAR
ncbi:hypothetical protein [Neorhizobium sp. JUb45]|uniref:hypothetical protein n=1 Tax=unclassified Neorhizobium TaxID=2629175 RepID=UPI001A9EA49A|nr:hypothetical protein [Neorhizobium sp. JUb45]